MAQKFNKIYIQQDAIAKHEDFDAWYEDGDVFLRFTSKQGWSSEKDRVQIMGRMGGQVGLIKPDNNVLNYYIRYERWEYILHTIVIEHHYYIEGMVSLRMRPQAPVHLLRGNTHELRPQGGAHQARELQGQGHVLRDSRT